MHTRVPGRDRTLVIVLLHLERRRALLLLGRRRLYQCKPPKGAAGALPRRHVSPQLVARRVSHGRTSTVARRTVARKTGVGSLGFRTKKDFLFETKWQ